MPQDTEPPEQLSESIADCLLASQQPPELLLQALATNTAGVIFRHYRVVDRPQVRVQYAAILSGVLKKLDAMAENPQPAEG